MNPVTIEGKEYVTIHDFARLVNKSYMTIYILAKYGSRDGIIRIKSIEWNYRRLILLSEQDKMKQIAPIGHPKKKKEEQIEL